MPSEGVPARLGVDAGDGRWSEGWNRLVSCDIGILKVSRAEGASANGKMRDVILGQSAARREGDCNDEYVGTTR